MSDLPPTLPPDPDEPLPFVHDQSFAERFRPLLPWLVLIVFVGLWEAVVRLLHIPVFLLPAPSAVAASLVEWAPQIRDNAFATLVTTVAGFLLAIVFGVAGGVLIGSSATLYAAFYPLLIGFNAVPKVAIVPILVVWFGIGAVPAILTAFLISFFPILVNVATGIATVEPELKDVLRALGASNRQIVVKVGLPRSMPYFFASLKVAITVAFVGSIMSETVASNIGIGSLMMTASARFEVPLVFAGLVVTAIMGILLYLVAEAIEKRVVGWAMRGHR